MHNSFHEKLTPTKNVLRPSLPRLEQKDLRGIARAGDAFPRGTCKSSVSISNRGFFSRSRAMNYPAGDLGDSRPCGLWKIKPGWCYRRVRGNDNSEIFSSWPCVHFYGLTGSSTAGRSHAFFSDCASRGCVWWDAVARGFYPYLACVFIAVYWHYNNHMEHDIFVVVSTFFIG